jgi:hypothetical protein
MQTGGASGAETGGAGASGESGEAGRPGGASGAAGAPPSTFLLGDFEDQSSVVEPEGYPPGYWYPADDSTGPVATMTFDAVTDRGDSRFVLHFAGGPTTDFGAFLGLDMPGPLFDASPYSYLSFWVRMEPAAELSVRFQNSRSQQYTAVVQADATWRKIQLPLSGFVSLVDGSVLDPVGIGHLQFWLANQNPAFHLYLDDVVLLRDP